MTDSDDAIHPETGDLNMIGTSEPFMRMMAAIRQVAPTGIGVLVTGESGTGKEMVARAIHLLSTRRDAPLLTVNCGAIPEGILESELFGHEKGSFTGAADMRKGYFESADGGTLFLDEIGEMPLNTQVKLLRVLETGEFLRVGGSRAIRSDVRVIAATNRDLTDAVARGRFRKDLFYRLNAVTITVPPLRQRREDIPLLVRHFAKETCRQNNIDFDGFSEEAIHELQEYHWPGNIRELRNLVDRIIVLERGRYITLPLLERHIQRNTETARNLPVIINRTSEEAERELIYRALIDLRMAVEDIRTLLTSRTAIVQPGEAGPGHDREHDTLDLESIEKDVIRKALSRYAGNRRKAAEALGIGVRTLYRKLREYDIE
ncbi:sigma-54-dependent Fis family transcriptional regulator [bacterium]|nr:sigma-54-dependent Fis family transcriptional regulator [bacterium]